MTTKEIESERKMRTDCVCYQKGPFNYNVGEYCMHMHTDIAPNCFYKDCAYYKLK